MAYDVANFISFLARRVGYRHPDKALRYWICTTGILAMYPLWHIRTHAYFRSLMCFR